MNTRDWKTTLDEVIAELVRLCREFYHERLVSLVLFGSVARGTMRPDSDLDVLIVADPLPRGRLARVGEFEPVDRAMNAIIRAHSPAGLATRLSPLFKTPQEVEIGSPLLLDMTEDARILYDRGGYFEKQLNDLRGRLRKLGARRIWVGDMWYWDLKPDMKLGEVFTI